MSIFFFLKHWLEKMAVDITCMTLIYSSSHLKSKQRKKASLEAKELSCFFLCLTND